MVIELICANPIMICGSFVFLLPVSSLLMSMLLPVAEQFFQVHPTFVRVGKSSADEYHFLTRPLNVFGGVFGMRCTATSTRRPRRHSLRK